MTTPRPVDLADWQVRAALDGRLGAVAVPVKPQPSAFERGIYHFPKPIPGSGGVIGCNGISIVNHGPLGRAGDVLWGRETWRIDGYALNWDRANIQYRSGGNQWVRDPSNPAAVTDRWKPARQMPEWASRLRFEVVGVRAVRVDQITPRNIVALCRGRYDEAQGAYYGFTSAGEQRGEIMQAFVEWWDSKHGKKHPYASNPWAWFVEIKRVEAKA